jgi:toxin FitB
MSQGFILDTCVLSESSRERPHPAVMDFLGADGPFFVPVVVLTEIQIGINEVCETSPVKAVRLSNWYQRLLAARLPILNTDIDISLVESVLMSDRRLRQLLLPDPRATRPRLGQDLQIAAFSLVHKLPIATFNTQHFMLIDDCHPLPGIYNPLTDVWHTRIQSFESYRLGAA